PTLNALRGPDRRMNRKPPSVRRRYSAQQKAKYGSQQRNIQRQQQVSAFDGTCLPSSRCSSFHRSSGKPTTLRWLEGDIHEALRDCLNICVAWCRRLERG